MTKPYLSTRDCAHVLQHPTWYVREEIRDRRLIAEVVPRDPRPGRTRANPSIRVYPDDFRAYLSKYHPRVTFDLAAFSIHSHVHMPAEERHWCSECKELYVVAKRAKAPKYAELTDEQKRRSNARSQANTYQGRGRLEPQPCQECGSVEDVQKHHPDYNQPLLVVWLCRKHHKEIHDKAQ